MSASGRRTTVVGIDVGGRGVPEAAAPLSATLRLADALDVARGDLLSAADEAPRPRQDAEVVLCWLALLLIRIIETTTGDTWNNLRAELQRLAVGTFTGPVGTYQQTTVPTPAQRTILDLLDIDAPPRLLQLGTQPTD